MNVFPFCIFIHIYKIYFKIEKLIAMTGKQPRCPLTDEWVKMWCIHTMGYHSAIEKRANLSQFYEVDGNKPAIQSEVNQKNVHINAYI